ncbi:unnamed protein product [Rotaria sordida]|uniref:glutathione gamma-glutamylcysteinyltransferase n=2 Tax=Rotaria sordida TaxID=392033 RepID=A0A815L1I4_9BILA|nr:unnamed protein product [Rotaria sordida]
MSKSYSRSGLPIDLWYSSLIIPLSSSAGQELFSTSSHIAYDHLNPHFEPQEHLSFCGIASASILLNTLLPFQKWTQSTLYSTVARTHMLSGITLAKLSHVLQICGLSSTIRYCEDETIEEQFRHDLQQQENFIIVNYWRQFQEKDKDYIYQGGHLSLIGGFNQRTDYVLIMDTSHTRFPHHWLPLKQLVRMMSTYDSMAAMPRGYLIVSHPKQSKANDQLKFYSYDESHM